MVHSVRTALNVLDAAPIHRCRYADEMIICCWSMPELVPRSWRSQKAPLIMITSGSIVSPMFSRRFIAAPAIDAAPTLSLSSWASWEGGQGHKECGARMRGLCQTGAVKPCCRQTRISSRRS